MRKFNYNTIANFVTLHFLCPDCGKEIDTDALGVPPANYMGNNVRESENSEEYDIFCPYCDWSSSVLLYSNMYEGYGEVEELEDGATLEVDEELPED